MAVVTLDNEAGRAIAGSVIVRPVIDAVALRVEPTVEVLVWPVPTWMDGGVNATPPTLIRTSLSVLVAAPSTDVSCDGSALLPRICRLPTFAVATGDWVVLAATALVWTVML